jgi:hypothetical protein
MTMRRVVAGLGVVIGCLVGLLIFNRLPWIDIAAHFHSQRGSTDCGHVVAPDYPAAQAAIQCALTAHEQGQPFVVIFSGHGIDEQISNALVGDSNRSAVELLYATGMVTNSGTLLKHRCAVPAEIELESDSPYHIPRLHCSPWPHTRFDKDYLFW